MNIPEQPKRKWPAGMEWQCEEIHMQHERERNAARMIQELLKKLAKAEQALKDRDEVIISLTSQLERATNGEI